MPIVSIVIPAKDEEQTIGRVLDDLFRVISKIKGYNFEVIVVNDGSKDRTETVAKSKKARVITNNGVHGKGKALALGFREAKGDIIIMMDADYSHKAEDIHQFIEKVMDGYGLVVGSRYTGGSDEYNLVRSFGNIFLTSAFKLFFGIKLSDALNGYKAFRKEIAKNHEYYSKDFEIEIELIYYTLKNGYEISEFPSHERERAGGKMKSRAYIHGPKFLFSIIKYGTAYQLGRLLKN